MWISRLISSSVDKTPLLMMNPTIGSETWSSEQGDFCVSGLGPVLGLCAWIMGSFLHRPCTIRRSLWRPAGAELNPSSFFHARFAVSASEGTASLQTIPQKMLGKPSFETSLRLLFLPGWELSGRVLRFCLFEPPRLPHAFNCVSSHCERSFA